jgi:hypothetical protein
LYVGITAVFSSKNIKLYIHSLSFNLILKKIINPLSKESPPEKLHCDAPLCLYVEGRFKKKNSFFALACMHDERLAQYIFIHHGRGYIFKKTGASREEYPVSIYSTTDVYEVFIIALLGKCSNVS